MNEENVFFILGSVRSGTTLLRDLLKAHPNLGCPEETHMFRWAEPFASDDYCYVNKENDTLKVHRQIDGVGEEDFNSVLKHSADKKEFMLNYLQLFASTQQSTAKRFFDKTPQNVYGLPLIRAYFPKAKIIHIVRNPLNVISSLKEGKVMLPQNLSAAINFWKESIMIINVLKPILADDLYEIKYEDLTEEPIKEMTHLLEFLQEDSFDMSEAARCVNTAQNRYLELLEDFEIAAVNNQLSQWITHYGYGS